MISVQYFYCTCSAADTHTFSLISIAILYFSINSCKHSSSENEYLWCHEWGKHGTCATAGLQEIHNEFDFFSKVLHLFNNYLNYDKFVLAKHGVTPSHSKPYPVSTSLSNALFISINVTVLFTSWIVLQKHFIRSGWSILC